MEEFWSKDFTKKLDKKRRLNPIGENCFLTKYGRVYREEDWIIAAQRIWRDRVYSPPGTLFAQRGKMYRLALERWDSCKS
jgi:hypothetical protein